MVYAIAIGFDDESTNKMNQLIYKIADANINSYMVNNKIQPHLTISLFNKVDAKGLSDILKVYTLNIVPKVIEINAIGTFNTKVIYLAPVVSEELKHANRIITDILLQHGIIPEEYYVPGNWIPHIALGVQLTSEELNKAVEIVKKNFYSFEIGIGKIVLAKCNPYVELEEYRIRI